MLNGLFYMIDSLLGKNNPMKRFSESCRYKRIGQQQKRKADEEIARLEQQRPRYKLSEQLKAK